MYLAHSHPSLLPFNHPPPPTLPCLPSNYMDSVLFFNTPLSPISTPHISLRKIANSISISRRSFPWPLNGISLSFPGTWQGLGAVAECRAWFSPDRAKWTQQVDRKQQRPLSSRTALLPWTSLIFICPSSLRLSLVLHSFGVLSFSRNLAALTHTSASSELFLARLRRFFVTTTVTFPNQTASLLWTLFPFPGMLSPHYCAPHPHSWRRFLFC